ncbi:MAG: hypothetical protein JJU36_10695 [Phycisphaeraceae bacterium]|nr:hypothetical protein [Phycisphaeraceae bacterium]
MADLVIRALGSDRAEEILRTIRRRATVLAWIGVVMQFVSGTWSWITLGRHYERVGIWADVTLATKMLLAGVIAVILFMQVDSQPVEKPRIGWLLARIGLVALLVVLASTLRQWRIAA